MSEKLFESLVETMPFPFNPFGDCGSDGDERVERAGDRRPAAGVPWWV